MSYQELKNKDYGINNCADCLEKQRQIDRLKEEVQQLRLKVCANQRKSQTGFFGSSTPSSQVPVKATSVLDNRAKKGGGQIRHPRVGRQIFSSAEADEIRVAGVLREVCQTCECALSRQSSNQRALYELSRERIKKIYYEIKRRICPQCRKLISGKVENEVV